MNWRNSEPENVYKKLQIKKPDPAVLNRILDDLAKNKPAENSSSSPRIIQYSLATLAALALAAVLYGIYGKKETPKATPAPKLISKDKEDKGPQNKKLLKQINNSEFTWESLMFLVKQPMQFLLLYQDEKGINLHHDFGVTNKAIDFKPVLYFSTHQPIKGKDLGIVDAPAQKAVLKRRQWLFEYPKANLESAWIQINFNNKVEWLMLPYGLLRDPSQPIKRLTVQHKDAQLPNDYKKGQAVHRWEQLWVSIGKVEGYKRSGLRLMQAKAKNACEISLNMNSHDHDAVPPVYEIQAEIYNETVSSDAQEWHIAHHGNGTTHWATFRFKPVENNLRSWGLLKIKLGEKIIERVLPSSVFTVGHNTVPSK